MINNFQLLCITLKILKKGRSILCCQTMAWWRHPKSLEDFTCHRSHDIFWSHNSDAGIRCHNQDVDMRYQKPIIRYQESDVGCHILNMGCYVTWNMSHIRVRCHMSDEMSVIKFQMSYFRCWCHVIYQLSVVRCHGRCQTSEMKMYIHCPGQ